VKGLYAAFGRGDVPSVLALLHPEVDWREAESSPYRPNAERWVGPDAVVSQLFVPMGDDWSFFEVRPSLFHEAGEVVTVEGRYAAQHAQSSNELDCQFCHVWTVRDGKIVKFQQYMDTARFIEAMDGGLSSD
jgi:ketosteroid isomerase-like protein